MGSVANTGLRAGIVLYAESREAEAWVARS